MAKNNEICTAVSISECAGKGTIGGYTAIKETTMKQIDTAQLDITACQAQAAEYHARGFNCAQAVACTLAPAVGLDPQTAFTLTEGFGAGMGGMTETCGAISGAVAIMGFVMSDGMETPRPRARPTSCRAKSPSVLARRTRRPSAARSRASDRIRVRSAAAPVASTMPSRSPAMC